MNHKQKVTRDKILITLIVLAIGGILMGYSIYLFKTNIDPTKDAHPYTRSIKGLNDGIFSVSFHGDYGLLPGQVIKAISLTTLLPVDNDTKVEVMFPNANVLIDNVSRTSYAPTPDVPIPLSFGGRSTKNLYEYRSTSDILMIYDVSGIYDAKLYITNKTTHQKEEYAIPRLLEVGSYYYYDSKKNENNSMALLFFTSGLTVMSISPIIVKLRKYVDDFDKQTSIWDKWMKKNNLNTDKTKIVSSRRK